MIFAILATCFFACSAVAANRAIGEFGSLKTNMLRLGIVSVTGALWAFTLGGGALGAGVSWMLLSGLVGFGLGDIGFFLALPRIGSRLSVLMTQCLAVPFAAIVELLWRGTTLSVLQVGASAMILGGVALALAPHRATDLPNAAKLSLVGVWLGMLSAAGQGGGAVLSRYGFAVAEQSGQPMDALTATWQRVMGGLVIALAAWWWLERRKNPASPATNRAERVAASVLLEPHVALIEVAPSVAPSRSLLKTRFATTMQLHGTRWLFLHALLGPTLGVASLQQALKSTPSALVLSITAVTPLAIVPLAWWLEGDRPTPRALIGGIIAVIGVAWAVNGG